ncbi:hypothetical protein LX32DRAFT_53430 [Colletotrichum zoysiae]|uniref:Uncharacterized protein n=1 Tax=Colletotrichum zoysiae TaxID=1216348 RepID=A0AAD9LYF2_9PEZI|nr:hypothetical protein LX32DRAFT_53430 [Colletotrichum zoysiae]
MGATKKGRGCNRRGSNPGPQLVPCMGGWNAKPLHHGCPFFLVCIESCLEATAKRLNKGRKGGGFRERAAVCLLQSEAGRCGAVQGGDAGAARSFLFAFASFSPPPPRGQTRPRPTRSSTSHSRAVFLRLAPGKARRRKAAERGPGLFASKKNGSRRAWPRQVTVELLSHPSP